MDAQACMSDAASHNACGAKNVGTIVSVIGTCYTRHCNTQMLVSLLMLAAPLAPHNNFSLQLSLIQHPVLQRQCCCVPFCFFYKYDEHLLFPRTVLFVSHLVCSVHCAACFSVAAHDQGIEVHTRHVGSSSRWELVLLCIWHMTLDKHVFSLAARLQQSTQAITSA